jgi:choline-sulfatase
VAPRLGMRFVESGGQTARPVHAPSTGITHSAAGGRTSAIAAALAAAALTLASGCSVQREVTNVVLISVDTCRADAVGCCGGAPGVTPNLDSLADSGVVFERSVSPVPITLPAHCSLLTGLDPAQHGVHYNLGHRLHPEIDTLAETLSRNGFATAAFVSSLVLDRRFGLDQGFAVYDDDMTGRPRTIFGAERSGAETVALATSWLERHGEGAFFLFVHLYEPHEPYEPPDEFARRFPDSPYLAEVAAADDAVGRLVAAIRSLGLADSTAIIVVGDHGEMLGEHGEDAHTYFVYQGALRVPFIMAHPQLRRAVRIHSVVGLVDVAPTITGILGLPPTTTANGIDLSPILEGREPPSRPHPLLFESFTPTRYGASPLLGLIGDRWKYIHTTRPELYDVWLDREESFDLAGSEPEIAVAQRELLEASLARGRANALDAPDAVVDSETEARLASLGYASSSIDEEMSIDASRPDPKDLITVHVAHTKALQLIATGRFAQAEPYARQVLEALPDSWEANLNLGKVAVGQHDWSEATKLLERSLSLKPAQYDALRGLGIAFTGLSEKERAIDSYRRALPLAPDPAPAAVDLACALLADGRATEARVLLEQVAWACRGRPAELIGLADAIAARGFVDDAAFLREHMGARSAVP